jgi:RHS repeat-associated protein
MRSDLAADLDREQSLEAMWHAFRASKFAGRKYVEIDAGVVHALLNARYYESARGQFISQDPAFLNQPTRFLNDPQQMNSYSYGRDNPITLKDPSGDASVYAWVTNPVSTASYIGALGSVAAMAQFRGLPATAQLLSHSLSLNPGPINAGNGSVLSQAITSNSLYQTTLQKTLRDANAAGLNSLTNVQLPLNFKQGDAATSFGKIDIWAPRKIAPAADLCESRS